MNKVGFFYHPDYLKHKTGEGHPERPERLSAMLKHLLGTKIWNGLVHLQPQLAQVDQVAMVHPKEYVRMIAERCRAGMTVLDQGDTRICPDSFDVALLAVGAVIEGVDQVVQGKLNSAFCAVRPPGHHAETTAAMGFCLFNNASIAARHAQRTHGIGRIVILDWDVHHGNGTQEVFYEDPLVLYVSLHQYPFYPGTGAADETGTGKGRGFTLNCPMKAGSGEKEYLDSFQEAIIPAIEKFRPELIILSAGFDAHRDDPLAGINLTEESFAAMTALVTNAAREYSEGRIVSVLEGGYDLRALAQSVEAHLIKLAE
ncbi:MAG: histone deacetylase [Ignavibacteriales bacterium]|nr:histone deacetylase [Ignavibacteriales bacterium]